MKHEKEIKICQIDSIKNMFDDLYSKYTFLCIIDDYLWDFANNDFESFSINLLFFIKSLDSDFLKILKEFNDLLNIDKK